MIELRWLVKRVRRPVGIDDGFYNPQLPQMIDQHMLQYREWPAGLHPADHGEYCAQATTEPKWIDVPMVREKLERES